MNNNNEALPVMQIGQIEINPDLFKEPVNTDDLPILATRNLVLFPGVNIPIALTREMSLNLAREAAEKRFPVGIVCQLDASNDAPSVTTGLYRYGVVADIFQVVDLPDGSHTAIVHARQRIRILGKGAGKLVADALSARVKLLDDVMPENTAGLDAIMGKVDEVTREIASRSGENENMFTSAVSQIKGIPERLNFIATNMPVEPKDKIEMLTRSNIDGRAKELLRALVDMQEKMKVYEDIVNKARGRMNENQRSAFLQSQMDAIREELYGDSEEEEIDGLMARADESGMPKNVRAIFDRQITKLRRLNPSTPDYSVEYSYLETLLDLPWKSGKSSPEIHNAKKVLEERHYGLEKVKKRILEQIAVLMHNNGRGKAPIICLVGPPGVGKTSLGRSIAEAMDRKYQRVSLGGVHDEAEIRGHRRTYIGAMPGRIIKAMKDAGVNNPVLLLDEVDKLGNDHKGDPSSALLEVLDPEQNSTFHDNYVDIDYDLSNVLFIATANTTATIDAPLLDRMELIELSGYLMEEKIEIARRHLLPKLLREHGLGEDARFTLGDDTIAAIIENYTAESGVRQLEKTMGSLLRKWMLADLSGDAFPDPIKPDDLQQLLGLPRYNKDKYEGNDYTGVVTGLAWTQVGGEILLAEASLSPGKGDRLSITGNLGDVMKESATIALQWVRSHASELGIDAAKFDSNNLHIHFPEGAIPKDGPSAGITIATAIASAFSGRKVRARIAMTGEITLRGKVLPVGGIKEKILAAKRAGIDTIVLSTENRRDIEEIPAKYIDGLEFHYVETAMDVINFALL
ncbi:MAG: endopeptidase La [Muribaculaceae bacterium]|nr:endopeptidase La [Muribaculaceae bacterium]